MDKTLQNSSESGTDGIQMTKFGKSFNDRTNMGQYP